MGKGNFTEDFRLDAIKQITERGHSVADVSKRLGVSTHSLWCKLAKVYEDGGFSGGNMDRPGLQELLGDVGKGQIDIIVVYKIDRLTRSLTDFAKLNDLLDKHQVSFVAVTQQFNTSTSMGRLTLNVLLSFAQFEREVSGERIRDKFAASKKKGIWMGGMIPLGYRVEKRQLNIVPEEADVVRHIFRRYLAVKSVQLLQKELEQQDIRSKLRESKDGSVKGGMIMARGAIRHMLKNPLYPGFIRHGEEMYQGQHEAIVNAEVFQKVQQVMADQSPRDTTRAKRPTSTLLKGLAFDDNGNRLQPSFCVKKGVRYYYYTSARRLRDSKSNSEGVRIPANDHKRLVNKAVADRLRDSKQMQQLFSRHLPIEQVPSRLKAVSELAAKIGNKEQGQSDVLKSILLKVTVAKTSLEIQLSENGLAQALGIPLNTAVQEGPATATEDKESNRDIARASNIDVKNHALLIVITSHLLRCGRQVKLILGHEPSEASEPNPQLVAMVTKTRHWFEGLKSGRYPTIKDIALEEKYDKSYVGRLLSIAFLAPDIVERILTGNHSATLTPERLRKACSLPSRWDEQRAMLLLN